MGEFQASLEKTLMPALLQCFGIMFLGYILGRFRVLQQKEAKGISTFVQYLALPSLIFIRIATISFEEVKWEFIAAVFVTKAFIFVCVALLTVLLTHPCDLGKTGMYAIAGTQSNDFALGYPLFMALYENDHTDYPSYLYLVAPIQLLVLNTIGFFIIEIQKQHNGGESSRWPFLKILKNMIKNPIIFMTIIGMIWNVSFDHKIIPIFETILKTLSEAFPATALLLVGHTMAIKSEKSNNHIPITVALLIITKNLILPIALQKCTTLLLSGSSESEIQSLSSFGFLYGTIPTAPSAYVFAVQYDTAVDVITKTIVGSTLLSAPLMFASAAAVSISQVGEENAPFYLSLTISYLSCGTLLCCSWLLLSFVVGQRFQNISFCVTLCIFLAQIITSIGGILLFVSAPDNSLTFYAQYLLSIGGIYATRIFTLFLAIMLIIIRWRSLCFILQVRKHIYVISILCLILPFSISAFTILGKNKSDGPNCQLGYVQSIVTFVVTMICLTGTVLCLILQHVCFQGKVKCQSLQESYQSHEENEHIIPQTSKVETPLRRTISGDEISVDVEDLDKHFGNLVSDSQDISPDDIGDSLCNSKYHCSIEKRQQCAMRLSSYNDKQEKEGLYDDIQIFQHTTTLIAMSVGMTLSLAVCFWKLIMEAVNGIYVELEFLDVIMNYGLGILLFIIFGFNKELINKLSNKWQSLRCCKDINQTTVSSPDICDEFRTRHERKFKRDIIKIKEASYNKYSNVFFSSDLIGWLVTNGAVKDIDEAETYILSLIDRNVLEEVDKYDLFPSDTSILRFTNYKES